MRNGFPCIANSKRTVFALQLIFSGEYTKAMNKDWHSGHFCCWQCDESLTGQRYVLRDEHPYCIKCYESVFANGCEECNKIIGIDSKVLAPHFTRLARFITESGHSSAGNSRDVVRVSWMNEQKEFLHPSLTSRKIKYRVREIIPSSVVQSGVHGSGKSARSSKGAINDRRMITRSGVNGMGVDLLSF